MSSWLARDRTDSEIAGLSKPRTTSAKHLFSRALFCKHPQPRSHFFSIYCTKQHTTVPTTPQAGRLSSTAHKQFHATGFSTNKRQVIKEPGLFILPETALQESSEIYRGKMHEHTDTIQGRHQSTL